MTVTNTDAFAAKIRETMVSKAHGEVVDLYHLVRSYHVDDVYNILLSFGRYGRKAVDPFL